MREIFEPSSVRLYIRPLGSRMKPTTGLVILLVSIEPPMPTVMMATEASAPIFQPAVRAELVERLRRHEGDDDRALLHAELKADRGRDRCCNSRRCGRERAARPRRIRRRCRSRPSPPRGTREGPRTCWRARARRRSCRRTDPASRERVRRSPAPTPLARHAVWWRWPPRRPVPSMPNCVTSGIPPGFELSGCTGFWPKSRSAQRFFAALAAGVLFFAIAALFAVFSCLRAATSWARYLAMRVISRAGTGASSGKRTVPLLLSS